MHAPFMGCLLLGLMTSLATGCAGETTCEELLVPCAATSGDGGSFLADGSVSEAHPSGDGRAEEANGCSADSDPSRASCVIHEQFGVFVSPSGNDATGNGTRTKPYASIGKGMASASASGRVYVCGDGGPFEEAIQIGAAPKGLGIYGGFGCADWKYDEKKRSLLRPPAGSDRAAVFIDTRKANLVIQDIAIEASDGAPGGKSSFGIVIKDSGPVLLRRVSIAAGNGGVGSSGSHGVKGDEGPEVTALQKGTAATCTAAPVLQAGGVWLNLSSCGSRGGNGGTANLGSDGSPGVSGQPKAAVTPPNVDNGGAKGAVGEDGKVGSDGDPGQAGQASSDRGSFTETGFVPAAAGSSGTNGSAAQGGGGGGASNATAAACTGATGGAGGMGGCGGSGASAGGGGGASVALMSWNSKVTIEGGELRAGKGGAGGSGGNGGPGAVGKEGASGGAAGSGMGAAGKGGAGGRGGPGGAGAGGNGGPSHALVWKGVQPAKANTPTLTIGSGGAKGPGGMSTTNAPDGLEGLSGLELSLP